MSSIEIPIENFTKPINASPAKMPTSGEEFYKYNVQSGII